MTGRGLPPAAFKPRNVAATPNELAIAWADGHESYIPLEQLRRECPCAKCVSIRKHHGEGGPLRVVRSTPDLGIVDLEPVGAYAVRVIWTDGHKTGIYPFERLRRSCPCDACAPGSS